MRYSVKWSADRSSFQLVLEAQNDEEDEILRELAYGGNIMALGETGRGRAELVLATSPLDHRMRGIAQQKGGARGPGRRREDEEESKIGPGWPWPKPPLLTKECRCPSCQYTLVVEAGTRCLLTDCPLCGHRMVEV